MNYIGSMDKRQLLSALEQAEKLAIDRINLAMPDDSVPDRMAIPILNKLEEKQLGIEEAFALVRDAINQA